MITQIGEAYLLNRGDGSGLDEILNPAEAIELAKSRLGTDPRFKNKPVLALRRHLLAEGIIAQSDIPD